jgi:hypothetical protein
MTNEAAAAILRAIYTMAMSAHPVSEDPDFDARYAIVLGYIAGTAREGLDAVREDRNLRRTRFNNSLKTLAAEEEKRQ